VPLASPGPGKKGKQTVDKNLNDTVRTDLRDLPIRAPGAGLLPEHLTELSEDELRLVQGGQELAQFGRLIQHI
jgi:hypothetical protein